MKKKRFLSRFVVALILVELVNISIARITVATSVANFDLVYSNDGPEVTYVFLGLLGEIKYYQEIAANTPGETYYVNCGRYDYDSKKLARFVCEQQTLYAESCIKVNLVGVSLGAQAAILAANQIMQTNPDINLEIYLVNPCMGAEQVGAVSWPIWLMQGAAGACRVVNVCLGCASFIIVIQEHSLANLQGELYTLTRNVEPFPEDLKSRTHVIVSANDEQVDVAAQMEFFKGFEDVALINSRHVDLINNGGLYLQTLQKQGLCN